jgi:secreted Zn-dependent insulinase-like peptidase
MAGRKSDLNDAEIRTASAYESGEVAGVGLYFAARINGVRVEIDGPSEQALALVEALCAAGQSKGYASDKEI